jgi:hypothetical protein
VGQARGIEQKLSGEPPDALALGFFSVSVGSSAVSTALACGCVRGSVTSAALGCLNDARLMLLALTMDSIRATSLPRVLKVFGPAALAEIRLWRSNRSRMAIS